MLHAFSSKILAFFASVCLVGFCSNLFFYRTETVMTDMTDITNIYEMTDKEAIRIYRMHPVQIFWCCLRQCVFLQNKDSQDIATYALCGRGSQF